MKVHKSSDLHQNDELKAIFFIFIVAQQLSTPPTGLNSFQNETERDKGISEAGSCNG